MSRRRREFLFFKKAARLQVHHHDERLGVVDHAPVREDCGLASELGLVLGPFDVVSRNL